MTVKRASPRASEVTALRVAYGLSNQLQPEIDAELRQGAKTLVLSLTTQANSRIVATEVSDGLFAGLFTLANGQSRGVRIERLTDAELQLRTMTRAEVQVPTSEITLAGVLLRPPGPRLRYPALVILHGWAEARVNGALQMERTGRTYAEQGYVTLTVSMRGWPNTGGVDDCGLRQPDDIAAAIEWLAAREDINPHRIGIIGYSQGGQVALLTAARSSRLRSVVAIYPVTDPDRWQRTTSHEGIRDIYAPRMCGADKRRAPVYSAASIVAPVLLIHGDGDSRVPTEQSVLMHQALTTAAKVSELHLIAGGAHGFTPEQNVHARTHIDRFLRAHLLEVK